VAPAVAALALFAHGAGAECPQPAPPAVAAAATPTDFKSERIQVTSDGAQVNADGNAELKGQVKVVQGNRSLTAADATYDAAKQSISASGDVKYQDPTVKLSGRTGTWQADGGGNFQDGSFELLTHPGRGQAGDIEYKPSGELILKHVEFTTCPVGQDDWMIHANSIDINQATQEGTAHDIRFDFKGVPILYWPLMSFPVGDARKSGWLFPTFGSSGINGFTVAAPYYLDLAPNYDATLTPGAMTKRGATIGGEFRYLTDDSHGQLNIDWIPHDISADSDRSFIRYVDRTDFTSRLRLDVSIAAVSDSQYFEDFGVGPEGTSVIYLPRNVTLTYLDEHWRAVGLVQQYQTIDQTVEPVFRPYTRLPDLSMLGRWHLPAGFDFDIVAEAVDFVRQNSLDGVRLGAEPTLSLPWRRPGMFVIPTLGFQTIKYQLNNVSPLEDQPGGPTAIVPVYTNSPGVSAPLATLDTGLILEREAGSRVITLEPRALYTYIPYRNQSGLPIFDTSVPDLNVIQLFRPDRYVGGDRIADANQIAAGVTSRLVETASGRELLSATLGQIYYLEQPRVGLPVVDPSTGQAVEVQPVSGSSSALVAQLALRLYGHWSVNVGELWDPHTEQTQKTHATLQYRPAPDRVFNLSYTYVQSLTPLITEPTSQNSIKQIDSSIAWPLSSRFNVVARELYSLADHTAIETLGGIQYVSCCWRVNLVGRRDIVSRPTEASIQTGEKTTSVVLQVELNGLSNVGPPATAFLERSIRGYSPAGAGNLTQE
jgi:LPS-assembly protein